MDWGMVGRVFQVKKEKLSFFLEGPEEESVRFAFFEFMLFQGFAKADDSAGGGDDIYMGSFGDAVKDLCRGEERGCLV